MKAMVMRAVGGPEVLEMAEVAKPVAGANQVLVRVKAAGVNPIDYKLRKTGALGAGPGTVLGFDVAGVIEAVGPGVRDLSVGEEVFYSPAFGLPGGYAEYQVAEAGIVARKPKNLSFVEAASLPLAGMTAWDGVVGRGEVRVGQTVLVSAINGGVGSLAVQICKAAGAYVFGTCSSRTMEFACSLGADRVIDYQKEDWVAVVRAALPEGLDLVFDGAGGDYVSKALGVMKPLGRIVTIVNPSGKLEEGYRKNVTIHYEFLQRKRGTLEMLRVLVERGQIRPVIDSVMKLEEAAEAHRKLEAGGVRGKVVLEVG